MYHPEKKQHENKYTTQIANSGFQKVDRNDKKNNQYGEEF